MIKERQVDNPDLTIDSFNIEGLENQEGEITELYHVKIFGQTENLGNLMTFDPLFFDKIDENPFKPEDRKFPVDFAYPRNRKIICHITIPEGYEVETLPGNLVISTPEKDAAFSYSAGKSGNSIIINVSLQIKKPVFQPDEYQILKAFYNQVVAKENEPVTLKNNQFVQESAF